MTLRFNSSADFLNRTTNLIDYNSAYTVCWWARIAVDSNADTTVFSLNSNSLASFDLAGQTTDGTTTRLVTRSNSGAPSTVTGTNLTAGTWYHYSLVRTSVTNLELYIDNVLDATNTLDVTGRGAVAAEHVGVQVGGFAPSDGNVQDIKEWSVALTSAERASEMFSRMPIKLANLVNWTPITVGTTGRVRANIGVNWTANGTLTDESPAPVGWGGSVLINPFSAAAAAAGDLLLTNRSIANYHGVRQ